MDHQRGRLHLLLIRDAGLSPRSQSPGSLLNSGGPPAGVNSAGDSGPPQKEGDDPVCHLGSSIPQGTGPRLNAAAGASLPGVSPRELHRVWSFLKWPLACFSSYSDGKCSLILVGGFLYFSKIESGRCQCESSHTRLRSVQLSTQRKTM